MFVYNVAAQGTKFGITAGYMNANAKLDFVLLKDTYTESGFYIGGFADFSLTNTFHIQPELLYASSGVVDSGIIIIPLLAKYYLTKNINIQAGPHFDILTNSLADELTSGSSLDELIADVLNDNYTRVGISLTTGLGYDIGTHFFMEARYAFQLNDYYTGDLGVSATANTLMVGLGYKF